RKRHLILVKMKKLIYLSFLMIFLFSCKNSNETDIKPDEMEMSEDFSDLSIFNLPSHWTNQDGEEIELKDLQGKVTAMVMIYTSCKAACPRLVADMRNIEKQIPQNKKDQVQYVFVSIDPEVDTPENLKAFAIENKLDSKEWIFLRGSDEDTREFAAVLAVNYKRISPIDFSHSNIISVFSKQGELVHQREGLEVDSKETIQAIIAQTR